MTRPKVIASANGILAVDKAMEILRAGGNPLDAIIEGVTLVEDDPEETSVGYGGLPNAEGEVELDASVMFGPTATAGAVGALKFVRHPAKVARLVMAKTPHVFLVGEGALQFALNNGFQKENLLTEKSHAAWLLWKEEQSRNRSGLADPTSDHQKNHGTINCLVIDHEYNLAGVTSTSGLPFKMPGRIGDSPLIGAGLYVDNEVGAAGSTGHGETNICIVGAYRVVELMNQGRSPEQACIEALQRALKFLPENPPNLNLYALNKKGESGAAAIYKGGKYCVHDGVNAQLVESAWLLEK